MPVNWRALVLSVFQQPPFQEGCAAYGKNIVASRAANRRTEES